ncbi:hypothetical protein L873DRAFT_1705741 [Choiromyces venosus 120613-1]|uniref:Rhodopsin domain-containing protein n=1 Tax=Choiromyces venosus 120613-1 TaxID=1336337 RepID=A0A3N4J541_9PEZI|nr:hypothetical protein L873DRAFT_1705741 [Choiromyces venosus 120613-1]
MLGILGFKVSLCFAYLRLVAKQRVYRRVTWVVLTTCTLAHIGGILVLMFQCKPIKKSWSPLTPGKCLPNDTTFYVLAAITIFFDICVIILPVPLFLRTLIPNRKKAVLIILFALFGFTTVCSVMRMVQILTISKNGNSTMLVLWGTIEMNIGITTTCIPTLSPLFKYFQERTTQKTSSGYISSASKVTRKRNIELTFMGQLPRGTSAYITSSRQSDSEERILEAGAEGGIGVKTDIQVEISSAHSQGGRS